MDNRTLAIANNVNDATRLWIELGTGCLKITPDSDGLYRITERPLETHEYFTGRSYPEGQSGAYDGCDEADIAGL